jgi:hypothetical protein
VLREYEGHIWTRQTWETDTQYSAFLSYRDLGGKRSIDAACEVYSEKKKSQIVAKQTQKDAKGRKKKTVSVQRAGPSFRAWAKNNEWAKRASEYDISVQEELDAVKLDALKELEVDFVQKVKEAAMTATLNILKKSSVEKIRKKYVFDDDGKQKLVEMTTEQQSLLDVESFVRYALEHTMPEHFGKERGGTDDENLADLSDEELEALARR